MSKLKFHIKVIWISFIARNLLGLLGLFVYPFINKEKARRKRNFWWLMLNDYEFEKHGLEYDPNWAKRKGITNPQLADYIFNAIRNRGYNWLRKKYYPKLNVDTYKPISEDKKSKKFKKAMEWKGGWSWFYPNENTNKISARYSKQLFGKTLKYGDFGDRYDIIYK